MTTRQKIEAFSIAAGICAAFSPCLAAGAKQAAKPKITAKPKIAMHNTTHRLNIILFMDGKIPRFIWADPGWPSAVSSDPPQYWVDAVPSGDTVEVNMPWAYFTVNEPFFKIWLEQMQALESACEKRHIIVKRTYDTYLPMQTKPSFER